ncbi:Sec-independent protein translocase protein TatB [Ancylobacter mangrovi]|uniref:Sec-independent protein translocase protein TatB n=1 Tax=Ancylobacter mangrovi TaxID=2972472 RepID=UPI002163CB35|nr:Sec-independent protein translocase protein TatB [Ancylobacter mangrovi]MCS0505296.1 Sec-independent protein translocase protein TatB [Ancylobacter mangrovi]
MLDIGWSELLVVAIIALVVIGPKELPRVLRTLGQSVAKLRRMAGEFQGQFNEALREAELSDLKDSVSGLRNEISGLASDAQKSISGALPTNPLHDIDSELKSATQPVERADLPAAEPVTQLPEPSELEPYAFEDVANEVKAAAAKLEADRKAAETSAEAAPAKPKRNRAAKPPVVVTEASPAEKASVAEPGEAKPRRAPRRKAPSPAAEPEVAQAVAALDDSTPPAAASPAAPAKATAKPARKASVRKPRAPKAAPDEPPTAPSGDGNEGPAA